MTCLSVCLYIYLFPKAAVTNCHKLGGLEQQKSIVSQLGEPEIKVLAGLDPLTAVREALFHDSLPASVGLLAIFAFLGSWHHNSSLHVVFSLGVCLCVQISPSIRTRSHWVRAHTNNLILTSSSAKKKHPFFQIIPHSQISRGTIQPETIGSYLLRQQVFMVQSL